MSNKKTKYYRFVGDPNEYNVYSIPNYYQLVKGIVLEGSTIPSGWNYSVEKHAEIFPEDWNEEPEFVENMEKKDPEVPTFEEKVDKVVTGIKKMLVKKNEKYGDSALSPIRVFSKASNVEQIKVRLDDKLSRLRTQHIEEDEDVLDDLIGYLVLLKIATNE